MEANLTPPGVDPPTIEHVTLEIVPLTPKRIADLATLFDQGGDPKWCWCSYFRVRGRDWTNATAAENRELLTAAARRRHHAPGLVAYDEDTVVGWVSLGPREDYERLAFSKVLAPVDEAPVWSIVCFVVGRKSRGQGVAAEPARRGRRLRPRPRGDGARGVSGRRAKRRADRLGERVPGHARDVQAGRVQGRGAPPTELGQPHAADRPAHALTLVRAGLRPPTSSVAGRPSSSDDVDMAQPERLDFPLARKSHALV